MQWNRMTNDNQPTVDGFRKKNKSEAKLTEVEAEDGRGQDVALLAQLVEFGQQRRQPGDVVDVRVHVDDDDDEDFDRFCDEQSEEEEEAVVVVDDDDDDDRTKKRQKKQKKREKG